jgi:bifunctional UDP-N-acetylglucosamine pyrophosphorylase/glucosamine-1-phosphate N-acetyltransferase
MESDSNIGPFSHLRPNSHIGKRVHIGNFVEVKNAILNEDTKVGHLTYVGDADLGKNINVGCGTVFVNYDGKNKHRSSIGDNTFIGCNVNIVAPVNVEANTFLAAGSTITKDVPEGAMGIARSRQENKPGYWEKLPPAKK